MRKAKFIQKQHKVHGIITEMNQSGALGNINYSINNSKSFHYKTSIEGNNTEKDVEIIPLKHLSNFWRTLAIH